MMTRSEIIAGSNKISGNVILRDLVEEGFANLPCGRWGSAQRLHYLSGANALCAQKWNSIIWRQENSGMREPVKTGWLPFVRCKVAATQVATLCALCPPIPRPAFRFPASAFQLSVFFCSPRKCPTGCFRMPGEMFTKLVSLLAAIVRHQITVIRPQSVFQKRFEWQSEFLFVPERRPFAPVSPMTRTCVVSASGKSHFRTR
jgi:hypothetical protein